MMVEYDPNVIKQFAIRLYKIARLVVFNTMIAFSIPGLLVIFGSELLLQGGDKQFTIKVIGLVLLVLGTLIGIAVGRQRAFLLRLQAQTALCQVQIAENTKSALDAKDNGPSG